MDDFPPDEIRRRGWYRRGRLPHFDGDDRVQTITFRLKDSLPAALLRAAENEVRTVAPERRDRELQRRLNRILDLGYGQSLLRKPELADAVASALMKADGDVALIFAWIVMPNHVHLLLEPGVGLPLGTVLQRLKGASARAVNLARGVQGNLWASGYFDRYIRDHGHFMDALAYIEDNPVKARLCHEAHLWKWSSAYRSVCAD